MKGNDDKYLTVLAELDNHYSNHGIGWIHPALLLNLLTYREKALATLKRLIQATKGTGLRVKFYMGVFKFLRDTIKTPVPVDTPDLQKRGISINIVNSLSVYLNIIRVNPKKIISFGRWVKGLDEPDRKEILQFLVEHIDNLLFAKIVEEILFLENREVLENLYEIFKNEECSPFGVVILREYLRTGFYTDYQGKFSSLLEKFSKEDCSIPGYTPVDEDLSRFVVYATMPNMSGSQTFMVARRESGHLVDVFNFTISPSLGVTSFSYQENVPFQLFREFTEYDNDEYVKVDPQLAVDLLKDTVFNMKLLSLERLPEFAFYRKFLGEDAIIGTSFDYNDDKEIVSKNGLSRVLKNPVIQKWIYSSHILERVLSDDSLGSEKELKKELSDHIDFIRGSLKRLVAWAKSANLPDYEELLYLYRNAKNRKFVEILAREIWRNRINFYIATR